MTQSTLVPRVSVLMPVLNPDPEHFRHAVESVLEQSMADWELIIIESPSDVDGRNLLTHIQDVRIRHIRNQQFTPFALQLNQGLHLARAPWVARFDADDICVPERLEKQLAYLETHPEIDVLGSRIEMIDEFGTSLGYRRYPLHHESIVDAMPRFAPIAHPSVIFNRQKIIALGGYTAGLYVADYDLWSRLAQAGARFANHPAALIRYRIHAQGMKTAKLRATLKSTIEVKNCYWREQMDWRAKFRIYAERLMLFLPPSIVLGLFLRTVCHRTLDES
jgi:glycosyltransferase involved in cell wall biosynthesis